MTGWLSFALTAQDEIWLDGQRVGKGAVAYLRLLAGPHHVRLVHARYGETVLKAQVTANRHTVVMRRGRRVGTRQYRWERSNCLVRRYRGAAEPVEKVVTPGPYCVRKGKCMVLMPGDHLYIQSDGRTMILPAQGAVRSARSYRPRPGDGFLSFYSYPPGALFLNGKLMAMSPVARLPLKPGRYRARVRNGYLNMEWEGVIVIRAGQEVRKVALTTPPKGSNLVVRSATPARIYLDGAYRGWTPAHVLPLPPGRHRVRLVRPSGQKKRASLELHPGQLEILRWP